MQIKPFQALRPTVNDVNRVASVPYDTVDTDEARELAAGNPDSFLHVIRPEIDLADGVDTHSDAVYARAASALMDFAKRGILVRESSSCLYVYRQEMGDHSQIGLVACCRVDDYENDLIKKHEKTRADKEEDRTRHVLALNANTGPVFLTYRDAPDIDHEISAVASQSPLFHLTAPDGVVHTVWRVEDTSPLVTAFEAVDIAYIADGHHRSAAAARAGRALREQNPTHHGDEEYNWFLSVLFGAKQLKILPYNRCVHDLSGMSEAGFLAAVREQFVVTEGVPTEPPMPRHVSMYLGGKWYGLSWNPTDTDDPVAALDVSRLQNDLLAPILGIDDPRTSNRIDFIGGIRGTDELEQRVDSGKAAVAFSMYPVTVDQMMAIADAGRIMPPKSTWFEPKLRSGLFVHTLV